MIRILQAWFHIWMHIWQKRMEESVTFTISIMESPSSSMQLVCHEENKPVAYGDIKEYGKDAMEVKRMFTLPVYGVKDIAD